jgi:surface polysaccharide O-acyltransferase-like enzyme
MRSEEEYLRRWKMLNQERKLSIPVNLIRTVAIVGVIVLHATSDATSFQPTAQFEVLRWWMVDIYQSLSRMGVPLFVMLTGALLLPPSKEGESFRVFFRKRWARIGLPFLFWGATYFAWDFFVHDKALTSTFILQGVLSGPYFHFWYLYMLVGLYLLTPILRIVVAYPDRRMLKYFLILWLAGVFVPILGLFGAYSLDENVFTIPLWLGYFLMGIYLMNVQVRRLFLWVFLFAGFVLTVIGTYAIAATVGGTLTYFFQDYFSPTMILAAVMLFLLLNKVQVSSDQALTGHPKISWLLNTISQNTLAIYLFHVIVLESLQLGFFGFTLSSNTLNSIVEVPLISVVTLFICLAVIVPLKKIPVVKRLIG